MAKPEVLSEREQYDVLDPDQVAREVAGKLVLFAVEMTVFARLNEEAARRGITSAELLNRALDKYLEDTDPAKRPKLQMVPSANKENL